MIRLIGDGGHAKVVKDLLGSMELPEGRFEEYFIVAIGDNATRRKVVGEQSHCRWFTAIHSLAYLGNNVQIGEGTVVMAGAVIQPDVKIGKHCIINTGATVDHDCVIGDYVHIAPGVTLCGAV